MHQGAQQRLHLRDDGDVYDALATSVQGDLLRDLYLMVKRSLVMAEQGGSISHVERVELVSVSAPSGVNLPRMEAVWRVTGTIEHWGHVHTRVNEYQATIGLGREQNAWKLESLEPSGERRVKFETRIRGSEEG